MPVRVVGLSLSGSINGFRFILWISQGWFQLIQAALTAVRRCCSHDKPEKCPFFLRVTSQEVYGWLVCCILSLPMCPLCRVLCCAFWEHPWRLVGEWIFVSFSSISDWWLIVCWILTHLQGWSFNWLCAGYNKWSPSAGTCCDTSHLWPLLLTWFNFNPSMDK